MAVFTSAYRQLAHGALNWDTQLDADMAALESVFDQGSWTPTLGGGSGATIGSNPGANGYYFRIGTNLGLKGRLIFGSAASFGTGTATVQGLPVSSFNTALSVGHGIYQKASGGNGLPILLEPTTAGFYIRPVRSHADGVLADLMPAFAIGTPAQSDQLIFSIDITT